ncbi:MAG: DUF4124 domain-containing protein [Gammaproteobacteria bacterium]|nr:DUF4124 domain-containing protein [Gammaproteobacteria bacterium]
MKLKILSMLIILGMLSVTPMIYMGKLNPMELLGSGFSGGASEFEKLKAKAPRNMTSVVTDEKVQVYKWRDKNGVMQFGSTPPPEVRNAQQVELNPNSNVVKAVKVPVEEEKPVASADLAQPSPYSVKGMKKVMDDAKDIEQMLQQSHEQRSKALNDL